MLLAIAYSKSARETVRNMTQNYPEQIVHSHGRVVAFKETELSAFLVLRLRAKHGDSVLVHETETFNEFERVEKPIRDAARAYETRDKKHLPYHVFVAGTSHPTIEEMNTQTL